jgi:hypothetical protein
MSPEGERIEISAHDYMSVLDFFLMICFKALCGFVHLDQILGDAHALEGADEGVLVSDCGFKL